MLLMLHRSWTPYEGLAVIKQGRRHIPRYSKDIAFHVWPIAMVCSPQVLQAHCEDQADDCLLGSLMNLWQGTGLFASPASTVCSTEAHTLDSSESFLPYQAVLCVLSEETADLSLATSPNSFPQKKTRLLCTWSETSAEMSLSGPAPQRSKATLVVFADNRSVFSNFWCLGKVITPWSRLLRVFRSLDVARRFRVVVCTYVGNALPAMHKSDSVVLKNCWELAWEMQHTLCAF